MTPIVSFLLRGINTVRSHPRAVHRMLWSAGFLAILLVIIFPPGAWPDTPWRWIWAMAGFIPAMVLPGYLLQTVLFPDPQDLDRIQRFAFSIGFSVVIQILLVLGINLAGTRIETGPILLCGAGWILFLLILRYWQGRRKPADERPVEAHPSPSRWLDPMDRVFTALAGVILLCAVVSIGLIVLWPEAVPRTDFYLADGQDGAFTYPRVGRMDRSITVRVGIDNHEDQACIYTIYMIIPGAGPIRAAGPIRLEAGETWEGGIVFAVPGAGVGQPVDVLLERAGESGAYRTLRIWLDISE